MRRFLHARLFVTLVGIAGIGSVLLRGQTTQTSQTPPPGQEPPAVSFRSSIEAVQVSVIVTDANGQPVTGLTQADFEILENGAAQPITTFSAVDIPIERTERMPARPDVLGNNGPPGRLYVIALDAMMAENALRARFFLRQFIEKYFGPNDTAAVVLTTRGPTTSGQDFTSNPRLLLDAIDRFGGGAGDDDASPWLREKNVMGDLRNLIEFMANVQGRRKALIFVSEGIPFDAYDLVDYRPGPAGGMFASINPEFQSAISAATRGNIAIYPIDPRGLTTDIAAPGSFDTSRMDTAMSLRALGEVTGGFALTNSNNYQEAFERLVRENSTYYMLGFNSAYERRDGRYVRVEVRVKRPGLQVRSTEGYIAPRGRPPGARPVPKTVLAAVWDAVASPLTTSGMPMRVFAAPFKRTGKEATVAIALEISASKLALVEKDGAYRGELEIMFAVTDAKNKRRPVMRHRAAVALKPDTYARVSRSGLRVLSQLPLPEGRYQLRVSAGDATLAGSVVYDVIVPDFRDDFSLSGISLTSARAVDTFTVSSPREIDVAFPGPPSTSREFARDDTVTIYAEVYENRRKPHTIQFTAELRDETGRVLGSMSSERQITEKKASAHRFLPNIILDDVPAGRYVVHVEARSSLEKKRFETRDIPITVR